MFKALNTEKTGKLTLEEFYKIYDVTDLDWKVSSQPTAIHNVRENNLAVY